MKKLLIVALAGIAVALLTNCGSDEEVPKNVHHHHYYKSPGKKSNPEAFEPVERF